MCGGSVSQRWENFSFSGLEKQRDGVTLTKNTKPNKPPNQPTDGATDHLLLLRRHSARRQGRQRRGGFRLRHDNAAVWLKLLTRRRRGNGPRISSNGLLKFKDRLWGGGKKKVRVPFSQTAVFTVQPRTEKIDVCRLFPGAEPPVPFDSFTLVVLTNDAVQLEAP